MKNQNKRKVLEAINELQEFLECDLYTKFRPEIKIPIHKKGKRVMGKMYREDWFRNEKEFTEYLIRHFDILRGQIKTLSKSFQHQKERK